MTPPTFAVSDPVGAFAACAAIVALTLGLIWLAHGFDPHPASPSDPSDLGTVRRRTTETPAATSGTVGAADAADA